jgi:hypothetical protein
MTSASVPAFWLTSNLSMRFDVAVLRLSTRPARLIGLSLLRVILGVAAVIFYVSDYWDRRLLWGPESYVSIHDSRAQMESGAFSLYTWSHSLVWFELLFNLGLVVAIAFTIFGGKMLTVAHAVLLWSLYLRNQDILEGGDNFARIALIFLAFTVSNAYFSPGASRRRSTLAAPSQNPGVGVLLHNVATKLIVFQVAVLYLVAGYLKISASMWTSGVAMYYISNIHEFSMWGIYPHLMNNVGVSWMVSYMTMLLEIAVPFIIFTQRAWLRKMVTLGLESMHVGIMIFMGLVAFGLIMIGADSLLLRDSDYRSLARLPGALRSRTLGGGAQSPLARPSIDLVARPAPPMTPSRGPS